jgi:hypothetical protein
MFINRLIGCGVYYYFWISVIPKWRGYRIRQEVLVLEDGATSHRVIKVPVSELEQWDATHDAVGRALTTTSETGSEKNGFSAKDETQVRTVDPEK